MVVLRVLTGVLLLAHGLVHLLYLAKDVPEFDLDSSWIVPLGARRLVGVTLIGLTIAAFTLLALAVWGVPGLAGIWPTLAVIAAILSTVVLVAFWSSRLVIGLAINAVLVWGAVARPQVVEDLLGSAS